MKREIKNWLAGKKFGRVVLHIWAVCLDKNFSRHLAGIGREFGIFL